MALSTEQVRERIREYEHLKRLRLVWETDWQRIADNMLYFQSDVMVKMAPGTSRDRYIYDTEAAWALDTLTQHIVSSILNFHTQWFGLRMESVGDDRDAAMWLDEVAKIQNEAYTSDAAFVPAAVTMLVKNWLGFGTGAMFLDEQPLPTNPRLGFRGFYACNMPIGTFAIAENGLGRVDTLYYEFRMSPHEAAHMFGQENLSERMRQVLNNPTAETSRHEPKRILHGIRPRRDRDATRRDVTNMPWESCYIDMEDDHCIQEAGFRWFPVLCPRWEKGIPWAPWGFGRGHMVLPESRTLQFIDYYSLQALPLHVYPPFWLSGPNAQEAIGRVNLQPGIGNPLAAGSQVFPYESGTRYDIQQLEREDRRARIRRAFFLDFLQFLPPADKAQPEPLGTTEMRARFMARVIGAPLLNFMGEVLNPLIDISFGLLLEAGAFPDPPESVIMAALSNNNKLDPEYTGPLARAQNEDSILAMQEALQFGAALSVEMQDPLFKQNLDMDMAYREWMEARGVPKHLIQDPRQMAQLRAQAAQAEQQQTDMNRIEQGAGALGDAAPMMQVLRDQAA